MKNYKKLSGYERFEENPFIEKFLQEAPPIKRRMQFLGNNGRAAMVHEVVNKETGEVDAEAVFMRYVRVDEDRFAKIYLSRFEELWELSKPAMRVFGYILNNMTKGQDRILIRMLDCLKYTKYKHRSAINTGLADLVEKGVIARTEYPDEYFTNPLIFFNGNRIFFAEGYVKDRKKRDQLDDRQLDMFKAFGVGRGLEPEEKAHIDRQLAKADDALYRSEKGKEYAEAT